MLKNLLPDGWSVRARFEDLSELSFWAVESRYPSDLPEATLADAEAAVALADEVLTLVERDLHDRGCLGEPH